MRPVLVVLALVAFFFLWDGLINKGIYTAAVEHRFREALAALPTGYKR